MRQIFRFLKPYRGTMALGLTIKFFASLLSLLIPWALTEMLKTIVPMGNITFIVLWGVMMIVMAVLDWFGNITANRMASLVARNATERIRLDLFAKINYLSTESQEGFTSASLISRATTDTYNVHQFLGMMQRMGVRQPIVIIGALTITFFMDVELTLVMLAVMPLMILVVFLFTRFGHPLFRKVQSALDEFVRIVREDVGGIRVIKALSKDEVEKQRFEKVNTDVVNKNQKANLVMGGMHPMVRIVLNVGMVLVIWFGAVRVNSGLAHSATLIAFMTYVTMILNAILFISRFFLMYTRASVSGKRISDVLNAEPDLTTEPQTESEEAVEERRKESAIKFSNVSFAYGKGAPALRGIDFSIKKGETLGIIGATGSGKSTLVSLMMRYYDTTSGDIFIDGRNVRNYEHHALKNKFGTVFQNDIIFQDTIRENIRFGRDISDEDVKIAANVAQAEFVEERGLDFKLTIRGSNLSGGQKQRIYIARALAGNPEFLVLDDSSSALDYATDARLRETIRSHYTDTTMVIVAQRVSSVLNADKILVLDDGEIVGQGQHQELMKSCPIYREIAESQMGEAEETNPDKAESNGLSEEQKTELLRMAKTHPDFKDVETYEDVLTRLADRQKQQSKRKMYRECIDTVKNQLNREAKANKGMNKRHTLARLLKYLFKHPVLIVLAIGLTITSNALELAIPKISGQAIDALAAGPGAVQFDVVGNYCVQILFMIVISCVLAYGLAVVMSFITKRILSGMRREMFERLMKLPVSYYDTHAAGDVISKITYDVTTINTSLSSDVITLASSLVTVIGSFIMMVTISPILVLVFAVTIPASVIYTRKLASVVRPLFRARSGKLGELNGFIEEKITGQKTIKAYNRELYMINRFEEQNETAVDAYYKADYMAVFNGPSVMMISNISLSLVGILGSILYLFKAISLGDISSFVLYSRRFSGPINESANIISELQSALAAAERVFRLMDETEESHLSEHEISLQDPEGDVRFENVSFRYVPEKPILTDVSLRAEPGKVTAIVGPTGAGKSTIISLLMRFYDIQEGSILIDGTETREFTRDSVRKAFAMVLQDTWLFTGSVFENVSYGKEGATREDVERVCKAAYIHNYIMRLPEQYDTVLTDDGSNISKGQKQLLTIARAMLLDTHMLILDEATSNVDTRTEIELQKAMLELMKGKTCFIIAHRLSTIRNADNIIVVNDGRIVEQGTHDALMRKKGFYFRLYEAQWSKGEVI